MRFGTKLVLALCSIATGATATLANNIVYRFDGQTE